jgi:hypothetical protein
MFGAWVGTNPVSETTPLSKSRVTGNCVKADRLQRLRVRRECHCFLLAFNERFAAPIEQVRRPDADPMPSRVQHRERTSTSLRAALVR